MKIYALAEKNIFLLRKYEKLILINFIVINFLGNSSKFHKSNFLNSILKKVRGNEKKFPHQLEKAC